MEGESRAEIETKAPFRSVKEAVMLFGERVLASELYATKLKEMQDGRIMECGDGTADELEETRQCLQKAREESMKMATSLISLQQELQQTKMELQQLKNIRESDRQRAVDLDAEDVKFVEDSTGLIQQEAKTETTISPTQKVEFQKKKYVTFANPPCVAQVIVPHPATTAEAVLRGHPKKKKKQFIPLIRGIFSKKRESTEV